MGKRFAIVIGVAAAAVMALGAQTALAGGTPVDRDSVLPDLQLWGENPEGADHIYDWEKQKLGKVVEVNVGCGDEACTVRATGSVLWWSKNGGGKAAARLASHEIARVKHNKPIAGVKHNRLKPASAEFVGPGETTNLSLKLKEKTRENARKALNRGKNGNGPEWSPYAEVSVYATDAAGNEAWPAQGAIKLLKHHPRG
jgi:hypothetical protein